MASTVFPAVAAGKTSKFERLTSGTDWTVPTGVTYVNATLIGGGGGGGGCNTGSEHGFSGTGGQIVMTTVTTTPGASISYAIGAGGTGAATGINRGGAGGTTTFTGATSAVGGNGGRTNGNSVGTVGLAGEISPNYGTGAFGNQGGGAGGAGSIILEYWV